MRKMEFYVDRNPYGRNFELRLAVTGDPSLGDITSIATGVTFVNLEPDFRAPDNASLLSLSASDAQTLMDELYRVGIRPTRAEDSAGALAATRSHLKDLQAIAFGVLANEVEMAKEFREHGARIQQEGTKQ